MTTHRRKTRRKIDPTGTGALRREYENEFRKRFAKVAKRVLAEVGTKNELGLTTNRKYDFGSDQAKVAAFTAWFEQALNKALFGRDLGKDFDSASQRFWGNSFANIAYRRGLLKAVADLRKAGGKVAPSYMKGAIARNQHVEALKKLYARQFDSLRNITREVSKQIGETLAKGLAQGMGPMALAKMLTDRVEKIGLTRARLLARTEVISAFGEATLGGYADAGIVGVELEAELLTAEDDRVCDICEAAAQKEYTIETARGVIPLHPNCRCAWAPKITNGKGITLT